MTPKQIMEKAGQTVQVVMNFLGVKEAVDQVKNALSGSSTTNYGWWLGVGSSNDEIYTYKIWSDIEETNPGKGYRHKIIDYVEWAFPLPKNPDFVDIQAHKWFSNRFRSRVLKLPVIERKPITIKEETEVTGVGKNRKETTKANTTWTQEKNYPYDFYLDIARKIEGADNTAKDLSVEEKAVARQRVYQEIKAGHANLIPYPPQDPREIRKLFKRILRDSRDKINNTAASWEAGTKQMVDDFCHKTKPDGSKSTKLSGWLYKSLR